MNRLPEDLKQQALVAAKMATDKAKKKFLEFAGNVSVTAATVVNAMKTEPILTTQIQVRTFITR